MSSKRNRSGPQKDQYPELPRAVARCELYLDRMALVIERAGTNAASFLPIIRRLETELAESQAEEAILSRLRNRRQKSTP